MSHSGHAGWHTIDVVAEAAAAVLVVDIDVMKPVVFDAMIFDAATLLALQKLQDGNLVSPIDGQPLAGVLKSGKYLLFFWTRRWFLLLNVGML